MKYEISEWGKLSDGRTAHLITIDNSQGISARISDYGGIFQSIIISLPDGTKQDIVLGYDDVLSYERDCQNFGGTIGRYANRIAGACITINGKDWPIAANEGENTLHGGKGFNKCMWSYSVDESALTLTLTSPHLDNGFPGNLTVTQRISFTDHNSLLVEFNSTSDMDTVCGLTNHSYFNFSGVKNVKDYLVEINADYYTPTDDKNIPTGEIRPVENTLYDFRNAKAIGTNYTDINLVINGSDSPCVKVTDPDNKVSMLIKTDFPGLQLYNGNYIGNCTGKHGKLYNDQHGICFEPQYFPDAMHHENFPSPILRAGETMSNFIEFIF